jgi:hypothetical protein
MMKHAAILLTLASVLCTAMFARAGEEPLGPDNSWVFVPKDDSFQDNALLDLRRMNEAESGQSGFIRLSQDGMGFVRGDGKAIRFWGVASNPNVKWTSEQIEAHFRFLAKRGVNFVRMHCHIADESPGAEITDIDEAERDTIWRYVAAAKKNGIYLLISPYWYHRRIPASWKLEGYQAGDMPVGSLFVSRRYTEAYKTWLRKLYLPENPYTGLALKDDPTLAICKFKNEDGLLWYTFDKIAQPYKLALRQRFAAWLKQKYGSLEKARSAWGSAKVPGDDWDRQLPGFHITWEFTQPLPQGPKAKRMTDELAFRAHVQRQWYAEIEQFHRKELGIRQLTTPNSWRGADPRMLGDLERWTYSVCDVITDNRYTGGLHQGPRRGYMISQGDVMANWSMTRRPLELPCNVKQVMGHPFIITETAWSNPNRYQSEGPMMMAAYMSLTGVDTACWFHPSAPQWDSDPRFPFGDKSWKKWTGSLPMQMDMFPASALMFRKAMVDQGDVVVREIRSKEDLFARKPTIIAEGQLFDPIQDEKDLRGGGDDVDRVSRLAFLVGPVHVGFDKPDTSSFVANLTEFVDPQAGTITSNTGQIHLDYKRGLFKVDTPCGKGVAGFLASAGGVFELSGLTIRSDNEYAAVQVVAMDDKPLARSEKIFIQVGTVARLTGFGTIEAKVKQQDRSFDGLKITRIGQPPLRIANARVRIELDNESIRRATKLDHNGYPSGNVPLQRKGKILRLQVPPDCVYILLH